MQRLKLNISYVGTQYCGWQIQDNASTIQGELEKVLELILGEPVRVHGAGRTDSGVHAEGQVAHVDIPTHKAELDWQRIFNTNLPDDICVHGIELVHPEFHSRFDAKSKTYNYTFWTDKAYMPPRLKPFAWSCGPLDIKSMQIALGHLRGRHDFACFQNAGTDIEDTTRFIYGASLEQTCPWLPTKYHPQVLTLSINANGFLKQMVRNIAGLLVAVGRNNFDEQDVPSLIASGIRKNAPSTAPACGLSLQKVIYPK